MKIKVHKRKENKTLFLNLGNKMNVNVWIIKYLKYNPTANSQPSFIGPSSVTIEYSEP